MHTGSDSIKRLLLSCLMLLGFGLAVCANGQSAGYLSLDIYFSKAGTSIDRDYRDNGLRISDFEGQYLRRSAAFGSPRAILIRTSSAPDIPSLTNSNLSQERAQNVEAWIMDFTGCPAEIISHESAGNDWNKVTEMLRNIETSWQDKLLEIMTYCPEYSKHGDQVVEYRKQRLMEFDGGTAWKWMSDFIFPELRLCTVTVIFEESESEPVVETVAESVVEPVVEAIAAPEPEPVLESEPEPAPEPVVIPEPVTPAAPEVAAAAPASSYRNFPFALRSNLLMPLLNVGIEVPLGNRMSLGADWYYPWAFRNPDHKNCLQALGLQLESRLWLGHRHRAGSQNRQYRLTGHSIGLFGMAGYYDLEYNYKGLQGEYFTAGLDYMYALRMRNNWRFEFAVGFGYFYSEARPYEVYTPGGQGYREKDVIRAIPFVGPVKANISLVAPISFGKKKSTDK